MRAPRPTAAAAPARPHGRRRQKGRAGSRRAAGAGGGTPLTHATPTHPLQGGGGGGKQKGAPKKQGLVIPDKPPYADVDVVMLTLLLVESYRRAVGRPLFESEDGIDIAAAPKALYTAPFPVLAHDAEDDPAFTYANEAAQALFEAPWKGVVGSPSRTSAEDAPEVQADRAALLAAADKTGVVTGYRGWRVSASGTRFEIQDGTLFNVSSPAGARVGQAVVFTHWTYEDGSHGGPGAPGGAAGGRRRRRRRAAPTPARRPRASRNSPPPCAPSRTPAPPTATPRSRPRWRSCWRPRPRSRRPRREGRGVIVFSSLFFLTRVAAPPRRGAPFPASLTSSSERWTT